MKTTRKKIIDLLDEFPVQMEWHDNADLSNFLLSHGVTVQEWIPANEPPKENGYYLCVVCVSAVNQRKEYRRMTLFWEDNVWTDMANCFRTKKPLYWMPMADMPQPPKGE